MSAKNKEPAEAPRKKNKIPVTDDSQATAPPSPGLHPAPPIDATPSKSEGNKAGTPFDASPEANAQGGAASLRKDVPPPEPEKPAASAAVKEALEPIANPPLQRAAGTVEPPIKESGAGNKETFTIGIDNTIYEKLRGYIVHHAPRSETVSSKCEDLIGKFIADFEKTNGPIKTSSTQG